MAILTPRGLIKTVALASEPELLGADTIRMHRPLFIGKKDAATLNAGKITLQFQSEAGTFEDALEIEPGDERCFPISGSYRASDFKIKVANDGDGCLVVYADF